jgi:hypothetical protein
MNNLNEKQKMLLGEWYNSGDSVLMEDRKNAKTSASSIIKFFPQKSNKEKL